VRRAIAVAWLLALVAAGPLTVGGQFSRPGPLARWMIGPAVALAAGLAVGFAFENRFVRRLPCLRRWRSAAGWALLVFPAYWVAGGFAIWAVQIQLPLASSLVAGGVIVALALGAAPWLGRLVGLARRAPSRLQAALARAQQQVGGPAARLLVLPIASANAFAFQLTRTIGVTEGALDHLDDEELGEILAHELGHLREPAALVLLRTVVTAFVPVSLVVLPSVLALRSQWGWLALWLSVIAAVLLHRRLQRALERRADAIGSGVSPTYAYQVLRPLRTRDAGTRR
jgi:Zn-dependent protease with chaperone function